MRLIRHIRKRLSPRSAVGLLTVFVIAVGAIGCYQIFQKSSVPLASAIAPSPSGASQDLINGRHWQLAGTSLVEGKVPGTARLQVDNTNLAIVKQNGSPGYVNPPINLSGTSLQTSGDFMISAKLSNVEHDSQFSLYGTPPLIEDEMRAEMGTLALDIDGNKLTVAISDQSRGDNVFKHTYAITSGSQHSLSIYDHNHLLSLKLDNQTLGKAFSDQGIFTSHHVWLGMAAVTPGSHFSIDQLTAQAENGSKLTLVDGAKQTITQNPHGFAALADQTRPGFLMGAAVALGPVVADQAYDQLLGNYNAVSIENAGKFENIHPLHGNLPQDYNFSDMDVLVATARSAGMTVHGHALIFGEANPAWVQTIAKNNPNQLQQVMVDHIKTVVGHYKGQVASWDVVNEPLADYDTAAGQYGLRKDIWYNAMGPDYIATALRAAHAADPNAQLWINDFGMESDSDRFAQMVALVKRLQAEGVPLTGVGFEAHIDQGDTIGSSGEHISTTLLASRFKTLQALGLKARISELDVTNESEYGVYADVLSTCLKASNCVGVTTWGVTDKYSSSGDLDKHGVYAPGIGLPWSNSLQPLPPVRYITQTLEHN